MHLQHCYIDIPIKIGGELFGLYKDVYNRGVYWKDSAEQRG